MTFPRRPPLLVARIAGVALTIVCGCGDAVSAQPETSIRAALAPIVTNDTTVRAAGRALEQGRPFEATRLLAPILRDPARRTPAAVLRAAEAASAWEGWSEVLSPVARSHERLQNMDRARALSSRAIALARRALDRGAPPTAAIYRLLYPVAQEGVLLAESARSRLDAALVAALIRQESNFTPHATSPAGARGLMQLMPAVGGAIARGLGFAPWDPVLLYQADINVQLGVRHLSAALRKYAQTGQALAAYNAGDSRVARWRVKAGGDDAEMFVERIPFVETRDYVRIILRNRELYRALYNWPK